MTRHYLLPDSPIESIDEDLAGSGGRGLEHALRIGAGAGGPILN